jgi:hypothetical protein
MLEQLAFFAAGFTTILLIAMLLATMAIGVFWTKAVTNHK